MAANSAAMAPMAPGIETGAFSMNESNEKANAGGGGVDRTPAGGGGVAGVWYRDGRVLLTLRAAGIPYAGQWCFPGGGMEAGEDEVTALKREWREELGTAIEPVRRAGEVWIRNARGRFPLHYYFVTGDDEAFRPNPNEVAEVRWVPVEQIADLPDLLTSNRNIWASLGPDPRAACEAGCVRPAERTGGDWRAQLGEQMASLRAQGLQRSLRVVDSPIGRTVRVDGQDLLNFAGNDYLGLAADPRVIAAAQQGLERWGWGAAGSRLICGHTRAHADLEAALARFKRAEAAIVLPSGYTANLAVIRTLAGSGDVVLLDKLNHASLIDAAASSGADVRVFPHRHYEKLERLLARYADARRRLIVTDSVFSMDGDLADLAQLAALKRQYDAILVVDEAHAGGVLGPGGRGVAALQGVAGEVDVCVGTLSKALGGVGGFIAGPRVLIKAVVNLARPLIFTTAIPAAACEAARRALELVEAEPWRREKVLSLAERLRDQLRQQGWDVGASASPIVPVMAGAVERAVALSAGLREQGCFVPAVRPPAVPPGGARLRISLTANHEPADVDVLVNALQRTAGTRS